MIWLLCSLALGGDLDGAWEAALATSDQAALVRADASITALTTEKALAGALPKIQVNANETFNQYQASIDFKDMIPPELQALVGDIDSNPIVIQRKAAFDANVTILQPLLDVSAWTQIAAARALVRAGRAREDAGITAVRTGVAQSYWAVIVSRRAVEVADRAASNARGHMSIVESQVRVGTMPKQALLQAELAVSRSDREVAAAKAQQHTAEASLAMLTGWPEDEQLVVPGARELPFPTRDDAITRAIEARPEVRAAAETLTAARRNRLATDMGWIPDINGRFTEVYTQTTGFVGKHTYWNAGINLSWNLFDGGYQIANQREQALRVHLAQSSLDQAKDRARIDAGSAWDELARAHTAYEAVQHELALATENLRLAELQLREGLSTFQDVEDARLSLQSAELGVIRETMSVDLASLQILSLAGLLAD